MLFSPLPSPTSPSGFTLLELMVAMAVIGVLFALAVPGLQGVYNRQVLINTANEVVTTIRQTENMALTNNQEGYAGSGSNLTNDCAFNKPYVSKYEFRIDSTTTYAIQRVFKQQTESGGGCLVPSALNQIRVAPPTKLPGGVSFGSADLGSVRYDVMTGKIDTSQADPKRLQLQLTSQHVNPASLTYYICITQGRVYAQTEKCW